MNSERNKEIALAIVCVIVTLKSDWQACFFLQYLSYLFRC